MSSIEESKNLEIIRRSRDPEHRQNAVMALNNDLPGFVGKSLLYLLDRHRSPDSREVEIIFNIEKMVMKYVEKDMDAENTEIDLVAKDPQLLCDALKRFICAIPEGGCPPATVREEASVAFIQIAGDLIVRHRSGSIQDSTLQSMADLFISAIIDYISVTES